MSSHVENPGNFNLPNQAPHEEKDKKQVSRRGLLIGLGGAVVGVLGGGAAAGSYLANRGGNEAPAPAPQPTETETTTPVETEEPTTEPAPTETETEAPVLENLVRSYGNIETDQSHDELVKAMSFEKDMTPEQIIDRFVDAYNYTIMGGASGTFEILEKAANGYTVTNDEIFSAAETRAKETVDAFTEAMFGENWFMNEASKDIHEFHERMTETGKDSIIRWMYTFENTTSDEEYLRYYESKGMKDTSFFDSLDGGSNNVSFVTKGMENVNNYLDPQDFENPDPVNIGFLLDPLDPEIVNGGKVRGFSLNFGREDYAENNGYDRPVVTFIRDDDKVMNL